MIAKALVQIRSVEEKISNAGIKYYQIDIVEDTNIPREGGGTWSRVWEKLYFPASENSDSPKVFEGTKQNVVLNFYPVSRNVGDKVFTDIKCNIVKFE